MHSMSTRNHYLSGTVSLNHTNTFIEWKKVFIRNSLQSNSSICWRWVWESNEKQSIHFKTKAEQNWIIGESPSKTSKLHVLNLYRLFRQLFMSHKWPIKFQQTQLGQVFRMIDCIGKSRISETQLLMTRFFSVFYWKKKGTNGMLAKFFSHFWVRTFQEESDVINDGQKWPILDGIGKCGPGTQTFGMFWSVIFKIGYKSKFGK